MRTQIVTLLDIKEYMTNVDTLAYHPSKDMAEGSSSSEKSASPIRSLGERRATVIDGNIRLQLTSQDIRDLRKVFDVFDRECNGFITILDLRKALRVLGFQIKRNQVYDIANDVGVGRLGDISFPEFLEVIISMQGDSRDEYEELELGFRLMDPDGKGRLCAEDLMRAAGMVGVKLTDRMAQEMVLEADQNGDGLVNKKEFIDVMRQTNLYS